MNSMINVIMGIFKQEPYPGSPEEWKHHENTMFREFYLKSAPDFEILYSLVLNHMSDKGSEGFVRYRLMCILSCSAHRAHYLRSQERKHPYTWKIRWKWRCLRLFLHRRFRTRYFQKEVELCNFASEVVKRLEKHQEENPDE